MFIIEEMNDKTLEMSKEEVGKVDGSKKRSYRTKGISSRT